MLALAKGIATSLLLLAVVILVSAAPGLRCRPRRLVHLLRPARRLAVTLAVLPAKAVAQGCFPAVLMLAALRLLC